MDFYWTFTEYDWNKREQLDDYIGRAQVKNLCFELVIRPYGDDYKHDVDYDVYVKHDDGYEHIGGGALYWENSFTEFINRAHEVFTGYIKEMEVN